MSSRAKNTPVGAYKILISVNPFILPSLVSRVSTSTDLLDEFSDDKYSTIFSSESSAFLELVHDFKLRTTTKGGSGNNGSSITLKTFDPGIQFLNDLFFDFVERSVGKISDSSEQEQKNLKGYYERQDKIAEEAIHINENSELMVEKRLAAEATLSSASRTTPSYNHPSNRDSFYQTRPQSEYDLIKDKIDGYTRQINRNSSKLSDLNTEDRDIQRLIDQVVSHRTLPKVYVMYGIGTDLRHWAGPFEAYLGECTYTNDGKSEIVEYTMALDTAGMQYADTNVRDAQEWTTFFSESAQPITAWDYDNVVWKSKEFDAKPDTFHDCIVQLLSSYLYKLGMKNHLIVLPNIDSLLSATIANSTQVIVEGYRGKLKSLGIEIPEAKDVPLYNIEDFAGQSREQGLQGYVTSLFNFNVNVFGAHLGFEGVTYAATNLLSQMSTQIIQSIFGKLGLANSHGVAKSSEVDPSLVTISLAGGEDPLEEGKNAKKVEVNNPFSDIPISAHQVHLLNFGLEYVWGGKAVYDWAEPVRDIFDNINAAASDRVFTPEISFISDVILKTKIQDKFGGGTFVNYAAQAKGQPFASPIDDTPLLLIGDRDLINNLVFGYFAKTKKTTTDLDLDTASKEFDFVTLGGDGDGTELVRENKDPFWTMIRKNVKDILASPGPDNYLNNMYDFISEKGTLNLGYYHGILESTRLGDQASLLAQVLPDEFSFKDNKELLSEVFDMNMPIFIANADNANILSYSFDMNKFLYGSLFGTIREIYYTTARRFLTNAAIGPVSAATKQEVFEKAMITLDRIKAKRLAMGSGLTVTTGVGSPVDTEAVLNSLADIILADATPGPTKKIRKGRQSSVVQFMLLFLTIFERQFLGNIKTIPMFHLSKFSTLTQSSLALIQSQRRISPSKGFRYSRSISDHFSGVYKILGFSHTITSKEAYSEFMIMKDIVAELSNE